MDGARSSTRIATGRARLSLLTPDEERRVLREFNDTKVPYPQGGLTHEIFEAQVKDTPSAVAVVFEGQHLTYATLNQRANQVAHRLLARGVQPDDRIGLYMERNLDVVIALLGILKAGGSYVPLDVSYPAGRLEYMLKDSAPVAVLTQERLRSSMREGSWQVLAVDSERAEIERAPDSNPSVVETGLMARHLAYVIYTSGSTGAPKGVMVEHRNLTNLINWHCREFNLAVGDRCSCVAALGFDAAGWEIWPSLCSGATLVLAPPIVSADIELLLRWWKGEVLTTSFLPTPLAELAFSQNISNPGLRVLLVGGDRLRIRGSGSFSLVNNYGPTESTVVATSGLMSERDPVLHIGKPISNTCIYILDQRRFPVPVGVVGELYIGSVSLARGYLNRPELTGDRFIADPFSDEPQARMYRTGDLGRWRANGTVEFLGRNDEQVKIRGYRIELGEIESQLLRHEDVREAVVIARDDDLEERRLVSYVVPNMERMKLPQQRVSESLGTEVVDEWKTLYEETYSEGTLAPSFVGWNSSYSGQPIPEEQMREWQRNTLERIRTLKPSRVLEIGCGTGLLLEQVAPVCEIYRGTDFSSEVLQRLRKWIESRSDLRHVTLEQCSALELEVDEPGNYDLVIMNSVVQYFPDMKYLELILSRAAQWTRPGGWIFVGDIRHLGLLKAFHASVQLERAAPGVTVRELRSRVLRSIEQEKELVIHPRFFAELPQKITGIHGSQILLKRGDADNELTRYRYDVLLQIGGPKNAVKQYEQLDWRVEATSLAALSTRIGQIRAPSVRITGIANRRLWPDLTAKKLIDESDITLTAGSLRKQISRLDGVGEDPEAFWQIGEALGYETRVSWTSGFEDGSFDVEWIDSRITPHVAGPTVNGAQANQESSVPTRLDRYANDPWGSSLRRQLVSRLRSFLEGSLPSYMVPATILVLDKLPLTAHGKLDRKKLPSPESRSERVYTAPGTPTEKALTEIWEQVLNVEQIGIQDNFFELGGHSLLSVKLISRIAERLEIELPVPTMFQYPTVQQLAQFVDSQRSIVTPERDHASAKFEQGVI